MRGITGCILNEMSAKRDEIYAIARQHRVEKLWLFGSYAHTHKDERPDSDMDFLVRFGDAAKGVHK